MVYPTHGQGEGYGGGGGVAHRPTPENMVSLPKTKFDPSNSEKLKFSREIFCVFHVLKGIFLLTVSCRHTKFLGSPPP